MTFISTTGALPLRPQDLSLSRLPYRSGAGSRPPCWVWLQRRRSGRFPALPYPPLWSRSVYDNAPPRKERKVLLKKLI